LHTSSVGVKVPARPASAAIGDKLVFEFEKRGRVLSYIVLDQPQ